MGTGTQRIIEHNMTTPCQKKFKVTVPHMGGGIARGRELQGGGGGGRIRVLLSHPRGGGVNSGTHPPRILAYPQTDKCPTHPPGGGGGGLTPTHPPTHPHTQLRHAIQKTKFFTEVNNHHVLPLPPSHLTQMTMHPSPFMGVGHAHVICNTM